MTTTIKITYGGETVTLTANLVEASAALLVDGNPIGRQTADARHRTADAVRLACIATWPEAGREAWDEGGEAWDAMAYEPADAADANADRWWAWHDQDASRASATMAEADQRCAAWVAGESDDGPARDEPALAAIADRQTAPAAPAAGISDELATGIRAYADRIVALGGYGTRVRATMPDGVVREGALIERGYGGCQPGLQQDDGRRFGVNLDTIVRACLDDGDVA